MRKTLLVAVVAVVALSGCGKKGSDAKVDCAKAVDNAVNLAKDEFAKSGVTDAARQTIVDGSIARCKEDKWSNDVLKCMTDAKKSDDVSKCQQMMTKEQSDNLAKVILAATPAESGQTAPPPPEAGSAEGSAGSAATGSAAPVVDASGLPTECVDYKALIEKLAACDKLPPASREMLKKSFDEASKQWAGFDKLPTDAKTALTAGCKQGADALKQAAGPTCGF